MTFPDATLLFLISDGSPLSKAITRASSPHMLLDHVGAVCGTAVIEAHADRGVVATPITDFLARAPLTADRPGWMARRVPPLAGVDLRAAADRCRSFTGMAYNHTYIPVPGALYCSELLQQAFLLPDGTPYFRSIPLNFHSTDPDADAFWTDHYRRLGIPVPQGAPGTSPDSIFQQTIPLHP